MKKKVWIAIGVAAVFLLMAGVSVYRQAFAKGPEVKTAHPVQEEITEQIMIPGTVELMNEQKIYASPEKGEIKEFLVEEGDSVKKGEVLAKFDEQALELELEKVKLQAESGYLKISQLEKQEDQLGDKKKELRKQAGEKEADKQIQPERDQLKLEKRLANLELSQVLLQKKDIEKRLGELEVKSTMDGVVLQVNKAASSDPASAGKPVIYVGDLKAIGASGLLSEFDSLKVKEGQKVTLRSDAIPEKKWKGEVSEVADMPEENQGMNPAENSAPQYRVEITVKEMSLKPGFQLIMEIETDKKKALTVPANSVITGDSSVYLFVVRDQKSYKQEVETGAASGNKIEITSGLKEKDLIITNPSDQLKDGMEVDAK
ncbi:efflux RND transporter periplasmic adaptor subunit [Bacillus sp. CMF12]|uniref:efflux RND transporter periplasmic adaptor subunit n=1 Tax=Bacillus sp. CMF12 TaxID=2884834 RepID=UPI0020792CE7|nr:efflux RND transporter periplasmic adaptor subunit [Bacillus sp. CMF12]USK50412.1 efflux RND transporter periplasmic adaptor subunit [Bacillus sp. CMF12]